MNAIGSRGGAVVRALASHQCVPGSIPGLCGSSLFFVLVLAPRVFLRILCFPPSSKINISKFQFDRVFEGPVFVSYLYCYVLPSLNKVDLIILFIYWIDYKIFHRSQM